MQGVTFPENSAYPIAVEGESPYYMLEIHYNNPGLISGSVDFYVVLKFLLVLEFSVCKATEVPMHK